MSWEKEKQQYQFSEEMSNCLSPRYNVKYTPSQGKRILTPRQHSSQTTSPSPSEKPQRFGSFRSKSFTRLTSPRSDSQPFDSALLTARVINKIRK